MKIPIFPGKYHQNCGFSMAMLVYRRVTWNFQMDAFEVISCFFFCFPLFLGSIHFYNGNPINLRYPLLQCLGRTQSMDQRVFMV